MNELEFNQINADKLDSLLYGIDKERTMFSCEKCLGYTNEACPNCGRYRVELYGNNKRVCEKCGWCIDDESYVDVFSEGVIDR